MRFIVWGVMPLGSLLGGALAHVVRTSRRDLGRSDRDVARRPAGAALARCGRCARDAGAVDEAAAVGGRRRRRAAPVAAGALPARHCRLTPAHAKSTVRDMPRATRGRGLGCASSTRSCRARRSCRPVPRTSRDPEDVRPAAARARRAPVPKARGAAASGSSSRRRTASCSCGSILMSAGRITPSRSGRRGRRRRRSGCASRTEASSILTEGGPKKRAGVWLETPEQTEAELLTSGRRRSGSAQTQLREILAGDNRRLHSLLRDQRALAGVGRARANEILNRAQLSPFALSSKLERGGDRAASAIADRRGPDARARATRGRQGRQGRLSRAPADSASPARAAASRFARSTTRSTIGLLLRAAARPADAFSGRTGCRVCSGSRQVAGRLGLEAAATAGTAEVVAHASMTTASRGPVDRDGHPADRDRSPRSSTASHRRGCDARYELGQDRDGDLGLRCRAEVEPRAVPRAQTAVFAGPRSRRPPRTTAARRALATQPSIPPGRQSDLQSLLVRVTHRRDDHRVRRRWSPRWSPASRSRARSSASVIAAALSPTMASSGRGTCGSTSTSTTPPRRTSSPRPRRLQAPQRRGRAGRFARAAARRRRARRASRITIGSEQAPPTQPSSRPSGVDERAIARRLVDAGRSTRTTVAQDIGLALLGQPASADQDAFSAHSSEDRASVVSCRHGRRARSSIHHHGSRSTRASRRSSTSSVWCRASREAAVLERNGPTPSGPRSRSRWERCR